MTEFFRRCRLHPWLWLQIVRPAVDKHTDGATLDRRRLVKAVHEKMDERFDPEVTSIASPRQKLTNSARTRITARNDALRLSEGPAWKAHPDYQPLPDPALCDVIDFSDDQHRFVVSAVKALADDKAVSNALSDDIVDALDTLEAAEKVPYEAAPAAKGG